MAPPYSYDLRKKVIKAVKSGEKKVSVCQMFSISRNTLNLQQFAGLRGTVAAVSEPIA